jgi:exosortase F-associated protein
VDGTGKWIFDEEYHVGKKKMKRYFLFGFALLVLAMVYLFQRGSYAAIWNHLLLDFISIESENGIFIFNRSVRLILNDFACMVIIWFFFKEPKYLKAAFLIFCIELFVILPIYLVVKLNLEGPSELSSPLLSQIHRIIVNPLLMIILIIGFVYQRLQSEKS